MTFHAWTEITSFNNVRKHVIAYPDLLEGNSDVQYCAKVKLHGTNAGVLIHSGKVSAQSRSIVITPENDNDGFAKWVKQNEEHWLNAVKYTSTFSGQDHYLNMMVYGEWFGPGIQKNVAASKIPTRSFAIFAARLFDKEGNIDDILLAKPNGLKMFFDKIPDTYILPWYRDQISIDWSHGDVELGASTALINQWVKEVEANDPWIEETFGIKGMGEGLVFYPVSHIGYKNFSNLAFKAKGEKHQVTKVSAPAQVNPETVASIDQFVDMVVTEARLEQGARAIMGEHKHEEKLSCLFCTTGEIVFDKKKTGQFVNWIWADVQKETNDEREASGLTWEQIKQPLSVKARAWYLSKA